MIEICLGLSIFQQGLSISLPIPLLLKYSTIKCLQKAGKVLVPVAIPLICPNRLANSKFQSRGTAWPNFIAGLRFRMEYSLYVSEVCIPQRAICNVPHMSSSYILPVSSSYRPVSAADSCTRPTSIWLGSWSINLRLIPFQDVPIVCFVRCR